MTIKSEELCAAAPAAVETTVEIDEHSSHPLPPARAGNAPPPVGVRWTEHPVGKGKDLGHALRGRAQSLRSTIRNCP
jgi:hypothetical protein